ncbi:MAG: protein kinase byr1 [Piptocephalis tieghemiana]|nr:MAG: protein kinase byr1 [Piptocephalis tieghemiana]
MTVQDIPISSPIPRVKKTRNLKGLQLAPSPKPRPPSLHSIPSTTTTTSDGPSSHGQDTTPDLDLGINFDLNLRLDDLELLDPLGSGNAGSVDRVLHLPTKTIMARKIIKVDTQPQMRKQILRELQILHDCNSQYIVSFYGASMVDGEICMCLEYMDVGSLDQIYSRHGPIPPPILPRVAHAMLRGLAYLYDRHRIIHRDIKPSNVLVSTRGSIKLCDFGVSGVLVNSIADTFVGTNSYMSPERIQGGKYTVKSDVWSVGLTLMEIALGRFPLFHAEKELCILDLLQHIVNEPAPTLPPDEVYPEGLRSFIADCLIKNPDERPSPAVLLVRSCLDS